MSCWAVPLRIISLGDCDGAVPEGLADLADVYARLQQFHRERVTEHVRRTVNSSGAEHLPVHLVKSAHRPLGRGLAANENELPVAVLNLEQFFSQPTGDDVVNVNAGLAPLGPYAECLAVLL